MLLCIGTIYTIKSRELFKKPPWRNSPLINMFFVSINLLFKYLYTVHVVPVYEYARKYKYTVASQFFFYCRGQHWSYIYLLKIWRQNTWRRLCSKDPANSHNKLYIQGATMCNFLMEKNSHDATVYFIHVGTVCFIIKVIWYINYMIIIYII